MDRRIEFYPWLPDWSTVLVIVGIGLLSVLALYLAMRQGRVERGNTDTSGKRPIHTYAGLLGTDSNRPTLFLVLFIIVMSLWGLGYVINIAIHGLGY